jgi:hypothetical protein
VTAPATVSTITTRIGDEALRLDLREDRVGG